MLNKDLVVLIIGRLIQVLILLVAMRVATSILEPAQLGNYYLMLSICSFFGLSIINPVSQYINRNIHAWHDSDILLDKIFNFNYYMIGASLLSILVVTALYFFGMANDIEYKYLIISIPLFIFFQNWNQTILPMINMLQYNTVFTIFTVSTPLVSLASSYILTKFFAKNAVSWFGGQILGMAILAIIALCYFYKKITNNFSYKRARASISKVNLNSIMKFSGPLSLGVFFYWMQTQSFRIVIGKYIGAEFLGFFGVGIAIATNIATSFEMIVIQFIYPKMYKSMKDQIKFEKVFTDTINTMLPIYLILAIFVSIFAICITTILVNEKYSSSYVYLIAGIWFELFRMGAALLANVANSKLNTKTLLFPYAIGGLFILFGTYFAVHSKHYEILVPGVLVAGGLFSFLAMYKKMNTMLKIRIRLRNFINLLLASMPLVLGYLFSGYEKSISMSLLILAVFGTYYLLIIYLFVKRQGEFA